jgi:hypothetical protein
VKKLIIFVSILAFVSLKTAYNQEVYKLTVKQPPTLIITLSEDINATIGEVINLDSLFYVAGNNSWYRAWKFWDGSQLQDIYDPLFTIPGNGVFYLTVTSNENGCSITDTVALNIVTGIKDISPDNNNRQSVHIYPNPNSGTFNVKISDCMPGFYIEIINSLGIQIFGRSLDCNNNEYHGTIELPVKEPGVYFLLVRQADKIIFRQKVIILN